MEWRYSCTHFLTYIIEESRWSALPLWKEPPIPLHRTIFGIHSRSCFFGELENLCIKLGIAACFLGGPACSVVAKPNMYQDKGKVDNAVWLYSVTSPRQYVSLYKWTALKHASEVFIFCSGSSVLISCTLSTVSQESFCQRS